MIIYRLDPHELSFPDPRSIPPQQRDPEGWFAVGGDLSADRLVLAYSHGIFPWTPATNPEPEWYCPLSRFVIPVGEVHVSHSMRTMLNKPDFEITFDTSFERVIACCSQAQGRNRLEGAWLGPDMIAAYTRLYREGWAHSVEVWQHGELVGGLYGVWMGRVFCGESMFSLVPSASKLALIHLCRRLQQLGAELVDCQFETPHLRAMGGRHMPYGEYIQYLQ